MKLLKPYFLSAFFLFLVYHNASSQYDISLTSGMVFPGKIQASWHLDFKPGETMDFKNWYCFLIKASVDRYVKKTLSIGLCLNYVPVTIQEAASLGIDDVTIHMGEIDATLKGRFRILKNLSVNPGIAIGYRHTFSTEQDARESGFCINLVGECHYYLKNKYFISADLGSFSQPYGGVKDVAYVRALSVFYGTLGLGLKI
jgi:hypothetical protein